MDPILSFPLACKLLREMTIYIFNIISSTSSKIKTAVRRYSTLIRRSYLI